MIETDGHYEIVAFFFTCQTQSSFNCQNYWTVFLWMLIFLFLWDYSREKGHQMMAWLVSPEFRIVPQRTQEDMFNSSFTDLEFFQYPPTHCIKRQNQLINNNINNDIYKWNKIKRFSLAFSGYYLSLTVMRITLHLSKFFSETKKYFISCRNQSFDLQSKSIKWFIYEPLREMCPNNGVISGPYFPLFWLNRLFIRTSKFCLRLAVLSFFSFLRLKCS